MKVHDYGIFMPPTLKKWGAYCFRLVRPCVRPCVRLNKNSSKGFEISYMDSLSKNSLPLFFSCLNYLPLRSYAPFKAVVELSFRKDRVHTVSMRALCAQIFTARA